MRESLSAQWVQLASIAVLVLFLAPMPAMAPQDPERYVLAEIGGIGLGPALAVHATVVENYEGNLALLRVTGQEIAQLRWAGIPITELSDRTTINFREAGIRFDSAVGEPRIASTLRTSDPHAFVVQFIGPIKPVWLDRIRGMGGSECLCCPGSARGCTRQSSDGEFRSGPNASQSHSERSECCRRCAIRKSQGFGEYRQAR